MRSCEPLPPYEADRLARRTGPELLSGCVPSLLLYGLLAWILPGAAQGTALSPSA